MGTSSFLGFIVRSVSFGMGAEAPWMCSRGRFEGLDVALSVKIVIDNAAGNGAGGDSSAGALVPVMAALSIKAAGDNECCTDDDTENRSSSLRVAEFTLGIGGRALKEVDGLESAATPPLVPATLRSAI